jgi:hypothetical protein
VKATVYKCFEMAKKYPVAPAVLSFKNSRGEAHVNIRRLRHAFFHQWLSAYDIRFFKPNAMLFDRGGTAESRNFAHFRAHRRRVHRSLALGTFKVYRLSVIFKYYFSIYPKS